MRERRFFYCLFVGALFFEWMAPLKLTTDTGRIDIFLWAFAFLLVVDLLRLPGWLRLVIKPLFLMFIVYRVFFFPYGIAFFSPDWLLFAWQEIVSDSRLFLSGAWIGMSPFVRTTCFLLFIWLMEAVMFRYVVKGGRVFWILLLTVFYLAVLDSFTPFDGNVAIVRVFCYGFVMLAFSRLDRLMSRVRVPERLRSGPWFSVVLAFVFLAVFIGVVAPKSEASWPNPVTFITSSDDRAGGIGGGVRKVGYGDDDSRLGGPFEQDETIVFRSTIDEPYYWRGESKDVYDGQGWHRMEDVGRILSMSPGLTHIEESLFRGLDTKRVEQETSFARAQHSVLFVGGQLNRIFWVSGLDEIEAFGDASGFRTVDETPLTHYELEVEQPIINEQQLRDTSTDYPDSIRERYLQLPDDMPERVRLLAEAIVGEEDNVYDRVKAVERYLKLSRDFSYETEDVPVPPEGADFVEHFLFDTQRGYCDHFSTSMVVLLRENGIPARWVKGFVPGESSFDAETDKYEVTVKNSNAHSWVEVYFEGVGWLPFEPTPSFSNPTEIEIDREQLDSPEGEMPAPNIPDMQSFADLQQENGADSGGASENASQINWRWIVSSVVMLLIIAGVVLWLVRHRIWGWRLQQLQYVLKGGKADHMLTAYERLLQLLSIRYGVRKPQQTVREYVKQSARLGGKPSESFVELTKCYEETRYNNTPPNKELWQEARSRLRQLLEELRVR